MSLSHVLERLQRETHMVAVQLLALADAEGSLYAASLAGHVDAAALLLYEACASARAAEAPGAPPTAPAPRP